MLSSCEFEEHIIMIYHLVTNGPSNGVSLNDTSACYTAGTPHIGMLHGWHTTPHSITV